MENPQNSSSNLAGFKIPKKQRLKSVAVIPKKIPEQRVNQNHNSGLAARSRYRQHYLRGKRTQEFNRQPRTASFVKSPSDWHDRNHPLPDEFRPRNEPIRTIRQSNECQESSFMTVPAIGNIPVTLWITKIHVTSSSTQTSHWHQNYKEKDPTMSTDMGTQTDKSLMASYPPTSGRKHKRKCHFCKGPHLLKFCTEKPDMQQQNQVPWEEVCDEEILSPQSTKLAEPDAEATDEELPLQEEEYQELKQTLEQELEMSFHVSYSELHEFDDNTQM